MRTTFTSLLIACMAISANAQTTALDFTADDCAGVPHNLFSDLDAGNAVVIDLVMMNCPACIPATEAIATDIIPNTSDPSRVKFYSIGYTNAITCSQMSTWADDNGFTHPVFAGMSAQTTYYGGMGMPTIIVLGGGTAHGVFYKHLGYSTGLNPAIIGFINDALAPNSIGESATPTVAIGPNPVEDRIVLNGAYTSARVIDARGMTMLVITLAGNNVVDVSRLAPGAYTVELIDADRHMSSGRFVKK